MLATARPRPGPAARRCSSSPSPRPSAWPRPAAAARSARDRAGTASVPKETGLVRFTGGRPAEDLYLSLHPRLRRADRRAAVPGARPARDGVAPGPRSCSRPSRGLTAPAGRRRPPGSRRRRGRAPRPHRSSVENRQADRPARRRHAVGERRRCADDLADRRTGSPPSPRWPRPRRPTSTGGWAFVAVRLQARRRRSTAAATVSSTRCTCASPTAEIVYPMRLSHLARRAGAGHRLHARPPRRSRCTPADPGMRTGLGRPRTDRRGRPALAAAAARAARPS